MELPKAAAVMVLPGATLFPQALLPIYIFEPRYRQMLAMALRTDRVFAVAMQKPGRVRETPCPVAGLGLIRACVTHADSTSHLAMQGLCRIALEECVQAKPYKIYTFRSLQAEPADNNVIDTLLTKVHTLVERRVQQDPLSLPFPIPGKPKPDGGELVSLKHMLRHMEKVADPSQLADLVSCTLLGDARDRQKILETVQVDARLKKLINFLQADIRRTEGNKNP